MKLFISLSLLAIFNCMINAQNLLDFKNWKIKAGDDSTWSKPELTDNEWKEYPVGTNWESGVLPAYDGYAWVRKTITISSKLKKEIEKAGGLSLKLATIDDADVTYFNGAIVGKTGIFPPKFEGKYDVSREYSIPISLIRWDQPNVIAVRIFDQSGNGGIVGSNIALVPMGAADELVIDALIEPKNHIFINVKSLELPIKLTNRSKKTIKGKLVLDLISDFNEPILNKTIVTTLKANSTNIENVKIESLKPGIYFVKARYESNEAIANTTFNIGVDPEMLVSKPDTLPGFSNYWTRAKKELASVDPQYQLIPVDSFSTSTQNCYLLEMRSLGNVLIRGWYLVPKKEGKYPAILQVQGYSTFQMPNWAIVSDEFAVLILNIRGHGNSTSNINPGFKNFPSYLQYQLHDKEQYIYRGAYMDCIRAVDFLFTRKEIDTTRIVVEGGSQGGALSFATAALDNQRIRACVPNVPFLSDFPVYFKVATWPTNEFTKYVEQNPQIGWEGVFQTLSYIDIKNLAPWVKAPVLMGVGLKDLTCPPRINFAAYNNLNVPKQYIVYPESGHRLDRNFGVHRMRFIRENLGMDIK